MKSLSQILVLASTTFSLLCLATAASPYPQSIAAKPNAIFADVERQLSQLDASKPAVFAYRLPGSKERWSYCFFTSGPASSVAKRDFHLISPPPSMLPNMPAEFKRFVILTDFKLVFVRQVPDLARLESVVEELWLREWDGNKELWFTEFRDEMVRQFGEVEQAG